MFLRDRVRPLALTLFSLVSLSVSAPDPRSSAFAIVADDDEEFPPPRVTWRKSYAEALEEARVRNAVIYLVFSQDSDSRVPGSLFNDERLAQYAEERLVLLAAHPKFDGPLPHRPERRVDPATRRRVERCPYYRSIHCRDHQAVARDVPTSLTPTRSPCEFLLAPDGQIILDGRTDPIAPNDFDPEKYIAAFHAAQRKLGRRTVAFSVYRQLVEVEADVEKIATLERGAPRLLEILRKKSRFPKPFRERVDAAEERYLEAGRKWIAEVVESNEPTAKKREQLERIESAFDGFTVESEARSAARDLPESPAGAEAAGAHTVSAA